MVDADDDATVKLDAGEQQRDSGERQDAGWAAELGLEGGYVPRKGAGRPEARSTSFLGVREEAQRGGGDARHGRGRTGPRGPTTRRRGALAMTGIEHGGSCVHGWSERPLLSGGASREEGIGREWGPVEALREGEIDRGEGEMDRASGGGQRERGRA
ncbi:hypothetical protein TRIUR3_32606 [Triticum urartu]|uniref:Uncharacterized protein n=1 Tax=Triticum urartu TaxID=4572 RepID=M7Z6A3_TRIUA|nr:hypothetical protein TRIUR3_32606 [Triticum urartu]